MKIISYNVNGIRAALKKGFIDWLEAANPDVVCIQETKAHKEQLDLSLFEEAGYPYHYWFSAQKKGYSSVAILSKTKPKHIEYGTGIETMDFEGRNLRVDFDNFSVMSLYLPSGTNDARLEFKFNYMDEFQQYVNELKKEIPNIIICGDYNICHTEIDIHNPKGLKNTSGFLPAEREWLGKFIDNSSKIIVASAILPLGFSFPKSKIFGSDKMKVALVGTGGRGSSTWGKDLVENYSEYVEMVGLCKKENWHKC